MVKSIVPRKPQRPFSTQFGPFPVTMADAASYQAAFAPELKLIRLPTGSFWLPCSGIGRSMWRRSRLLWQSNARETQLSVERRLLLLSIQANPTIDIPMKNPIAPSIT